MNELEKMYHEMLSQLEAGITDLEKFDVYPSAYANMWASKQQGKGKC